jgi:hypothetical protein
MSDRRRRLPLLAIALVAISLAWRAAADPAPAFDVEFDGVDPDSIVAFDAQERALGPDVTGEPSEAITVMGGGSESIIYLVFVGEASRFEFASTGQPFAVSLRRHTGSVTDELIRWDTVQVPAGSAVALSITSAGAATLRYAGSTVVAPTASFAGIAAADTTPPEVTHRLEPDGRHALHLLDGGNDITSPERLVYSLDGGQRYLPYQGPFAVDPRETPTLFTVGRDALGNTSQIYQYSMVEPLCDRVQRDRSTLRSLVSAALAKAIAQGHVPAVPGVALLAEGDAACLWRRDSGGGDVSCTSCGGVYVPASTPVQIAVLFPASVSSASRSAVLTLFGQEASDRKAALPAVVFSSENRADFEAGRVDLASASPADDAGLARGLRLLARALFGEYVDLGAGAPNVAGASLESVATALRNAGLSRAEGFEAGLLGDLQQRRGGVMLRLVGAARGAIGDTPERDSYENRIVRTQLDTASHALAEAALGLLVADTCGAENALAFRSRAQAQSNACGGAACRSFDAYASARVAASRAVCPDVFSATEVVDLEQAARIGNGDGATLAALFANECAANTLLGGSLRTVRAFRDRAAAARSVALAAAAPGERTARETNAAAAESALAALNQAATQNLKLRIANNGSVAFSGVVLRGYENGSPTGQQRTFDVGPDRALAIEGDAARDVPFFLRRNLAGATLNEIASVVFVLDPDAALAPNTEGARVAGVQYYVFDPTHAICPLPAEPNSPVPTTGGP